MYEDKILDDVSKKIGIPKNKLKIVPRGRFGVLEPDLEVTVTETITVDGETYNAGERVAIVEVKYLSDPKNVEYFERRISGAREQLTDKYFKSKEWTAPYGMICIIAWPAQEVINDIPHPPKVEGRTIGKSYNNTCIETIENTEYLTHVLSLKFLNKLKSYLDERLKEEVIVCRFEPFEVYVPGLATETNGRCERRVSLESWTLSRIKTR